MTRERVNDDPDVGLLLKASVNGLRDDPKSAKARFKAAAAGFCAFHRVTHRSITPEQCLDSQMTEKTLQDRIRDRAQRRGWKVAHAGRGIAAFTAEGDPVFVTPMPKGWPDLVMLHPVWQEARVIECKREDNDLDPEQVMWLQWFNACGIPAVMCKPSDLREGRVNAILARQR